MPAHFVHASSPAEAPLDAFFASQPGHLPSALSVCTPSQWGQASVESILAPDIFWPHFGHVPSAFSVCLPSQCEHWSADIIFASLPLSSLFLHPADTTSSAPSTETNSLFITN